MVDEVKNVYEAGLQQTKTMVDAVWEKASVVVTTSLLAAEVVDGGALMKVANSTEAKALFTAWQELAADGGVVADSHARFVEANDIFRTLFEGLHSAHDYTATTDRHQFCRDKVTEMIAIRVTFRNKKPTELNKNKAIQDASEKIKQIDGVIPVRLSLLMSAAKAEDSSKS